MPRLFISHSSKDNAPALAFQNWLVAAGWTREDVFIDLHGIGAGERWRDTLRQANKQCEAVILLASPASLESVECQREMSLAEDQGKEIIVVLLRALTKDDPRLARYRDRQFVDLSAKPTEPMEPFEFNGKVRRVSFNLAALNSIKARLANLGIAPESFAWPPKGVTKPQPYPGLAFFTEDDAGIFFGRDADILSALTDIRQVRRRRAPRLIVIDAASGAGKSSFLRAVLWPRLKRDPDFAALAVLRPAQGIITGPDGIGRRIATFFAEFGKPTAPGPINAAIGNSDAVAGAKALADLLQEAGQIEFFGKRIKERRTSLSLVAILSWFLFVASFLMAACLLGAVYRVAVYRLAAVYLPVVHLAFLPAFLEIVDAWHKWALLTMIGSAAVGGAIRYYMERLSAEHELFSYQDALVTFTRARDDLAELGGDTSAGAQQQRRDIIVALGREALDENEARIRAHRVRPLEPFVSG